MLNSTLRQTAQHLRLSTQQQIMFQLQISEMEHNTHCFETGLQLLNLIFDGNEDHPDYSILSRDKNFWNWFKNEYTLAQKDWLKKAQTFTLPNIKIEKILYNQHMEFKCVQSIKIHNSFDHWLKIQ